MITQHIREFIIMLLWRHKGARTCEDAERTDKEKGGGIVELVEKRRDM